MNNFTFVVAKAYREDVPPLVIARAHGWDAWEHFFTHASRKYPVTCMMFVDNGVDYITRAYDPVVGLEQ